MKKRDAVLRISLLGLVAVVLGTAAGMTGSEVGMVPEVAVASVEDGVATPMPRAARLPAEMSEEDREIFNWVTELRAERAPARRSDSEFPYSCDIDAVYFMGTAYWVLIDDFVEHLEPNFWDCWISGYNGEFNPDINTADTIINGHAIPLPGSIFHYQDEDHVLWWGLYRGESLLGYCSGNVSECGGGFYYVNDDDFTCEESLVVVLWDHRDYPPNSYNFFDVELFEDIPWDEYEACS